MKLFEGSTVTHRVLSWDDDETIDRDAVISAAREAGLDGYGTPLSGIEKFADAITRPLREQINELEHEVVALRKLALELQNTAIKYQDDIVRGLGE